MLQFSPAPTGDMHIGELRIAIFSYLLAKQRDEQLIIRIEDMDKARNIEGKDTEILQILEKFALTYSRVFHQSEHLHIHQTLAIRLLEEDKAFVCTCTAKQLEQEKEEARKKGVAYRYSGRCESMKSGELERLKSEKISFVIRIKKPETPLVIHDLIRGDIETMPEEMDSFVILDANAVPTYDFACACDDMLAGIDHIIRSEDALGNTSRQIHIRNLLKYDRETDYAHLPVILNAKGSKMRIRDDAGSLKWLLNEGFIPDAILNYLILLGNKTPKEVFTLPEAVEWFELETLSKAPVRFNLDKLRLLNRAHLERMDDRQLSMLFGFADAEIGKLAKVYLEESGTLNELEHRISAIFAPKAYTGRWDEEIQTLRKVIADAPMLEDFDDFISYLTQKSGLDASHLAEPLRILMTGTDQGPELSDIYPYIKSYLLEIAS